MISHCFFIGTTLANNPVSHHFLALSEELVTRGHRVVVLAPHRQTQLENHNANPAIFTWPSERPTQWRDAAFLKKLIDRYRPSCLISNFVAVNIMTSIGCLTRVPVRVAWYHTVTDQLQHDSVVPRWKRQWLTVRKRLIYRAATHLVANSAASAEDLKSQFLVPGKKCRVFHNAIADPFKQGIPQQIPTEAHLVCVGRLYPSKGQDVLINALAILRKSVPNFHVEFIGEGPSQAIFERLARHVGVRDKCTFTGRLDHTEVLRRMAKSTATIVPSRTEAFGLVNIESLAVGTPVIASRVGGIVEIIRDGLDGFLVPPDDPDALATKLSVVLKEPQIRHEMRKNARERFLSAFEQRRAVIEQADWHEKLLTNYESPTLGHMRYGQSA